MARVGFLQMDFLRFGYKIKKIEVMATSISKIRSAIRAKGGLKKFSSYDKKQDPLADQHGLI